MALVGMMVGALVMVTILSWLLEWAIFKRVCESPATGIPASVAAAVVLAIMLYGFGNADGGPWNPMPGGLAYVIAGCIVAAIRVGLYKRKAPEEGVENVFQ